MKALKIVGSILLVLVLVASTYIGVITKGFRKWANLKTEKQKVVNFYNYGKTGISSEDYQKLEKEKSTLADQLDKLTEENESLNKKYFNPNCNVKFLYNDFAFEYDAYFFYGTSTDLKNEVSKQSLSFTRYKKIGFTEDLNSDHCTFSYSKVFEVILPSGHTENVSIIQEFETFVVSTISSRNVSYEFGENITKKQKDDILSYMNSPDSIDSSYTDIFYYVNYIFTYTVNESGLYDFNLIVKFIEKA